jgi:hypothetical protein
MNQKDIGNLFSYPQPQSQANSGHLLPPSVNLKPNSKAVRGLAKMRIVPLDGPTGNDISIDTYTLLLNPNSVSESRSSNWVKHYVPGYDSPLLQWINGTERVISFTALVTKDLANTGTLTTDQPSLANKVFSLNTNTAVTEAYQNVPATQASLLAKTSNLTATAGTNFQVLGVSQEQLRNVSNQAIKSVASVTDTKNSTKTIFPLSISNNLAFYRSLLMPRESGSNIADAPPLVKLEMGSILADKETAVNLRFILLNYNITVTKMTPDLEPIEAQVGFTFIEYVPENRKVAKFKKAGTNRAEQSGISPQLNNEKKDLVDGESTMINGRKVISGVPFNEA